MRQVHLLYHELRAAAADYSYVVSADLFQAHVHLYAKLVSSGAPIKPVVTFDDGHISNIELAAPILSSYGIMAHFFITVGWTGSRSEFMGWAQVRELLESGHRIGAHGWSHALLTHCTPAQLDLELRRARNVLEDKLGTAITTMSLPGGRSNRRVITACREAGYTHVYTSVPRAEPISPGPMIGRLNIRGNTPAEWLSQLFRPSSPQLARLNRTYHLKTAARLLVGDRLYGHIWGILNRKEAEIDPEMTASVGNPEAATRRDPSI